MKRCSWAQGNDALMRDYHDSEFGRKKHTDSALFEKLCLEIFQAGLSWRTVLHKREAFREVLFGFDAERVARMTPVDADALMTDSRIIRNRRKIDAVIHNARLMRIQFAQADSFLAYVYSFGDGMTLHKDLKKRGFLFAGPTVCESFLGSVGAMEAHEPGCEFWGHR
jgi:DNA-3-methyladenine glycosylase I